MSNIEHILVQTSEAGQRIDAFLAVKTGITRSRIQKWIGMRKVLVNGVTTSQKYRVRTDDVITLSRPDEEVKGLVPEAIPVEVLYEDEYVVVVDKPAGMVVYPAAGHGQNTLMNALAHHCRRLADIGGPLRPGVVHRLDRDTSGVMVVAVEDGAYYHLVEQFKRRTIKRRYVTLVFGNLKADAGEIALPIGRSGSDRKKMSTRVRKGKDAVTRWKVLRRFVVATLVEVRLGTGRTHQIRVHFSSIGHPVLGDRTYGRKTEIEAGKRKTAFPRQMLHAEMLGFVHPAYGEYMEFSSPLPDDMRKVLDVLESIRA
ncbi:MAG TPA: RluA family pseudouridine synthase [Thermodesulfovibrionales bacterium]|nr:RluA family pseudouridine synthase [Thermodesulfovibrionales bacterium]